MTTTYAYNGDNFSSLGGSTTITDPHGNVEIEQYANGFLTQLTKAAGTAIQATTTYAYDPSTYGITSLTDPNGNVTTHTYNASGQVLSTTDPLGKQTSYTYNSLEEVLTTTTPLGEVTTKTYDANGNLTAVTDPLGDQTGQTYGDSTHPGDVTAITDPDGRVTQLTYDSYGDVASRSISPSSGNTDTTAFVYDADSELVCQASANAAASGVNCPAAGRARVSDTTTNAYDGDGELTSSTDPNGHTTSYGYDGDGNKVSVTDPSGNVTASAYDADDRLVTKTVGANGSSPATTTYAYDIAPGMGSCQTLSGTSYCTTTKDPNGGTTIDYYDARGQQIEETLPGGQSTQFTYDLAGNKITKIDASGRTTTYSYDTDNRLTGISYSDGSTPNVSYGYNADGERTTMIDGTGTTSYALDAAQRTTAVTNGAGATTSYGYDKNGDITTLSYPNGQTVTRSYDGADRLVSVVDWLGHTTTFGYDPDGNLTTTTYPNGNTVKASYDPTDAMSATSVGSSHGTLASIAYTRNPANLITQELDTGAIQAKTAYAYDPRRELISAGASSFGYDAAGNLTTNATAKQAFDPTSQLTTNTVSGVATSYSYTPEGERAAATPSWGIPSKYRYDQAGRLTAVTHATPAPAITSIAPASGPTAGATTVTINGNGFATATSVAFGGSAASHVKVISDSQLTVVSPAQGGGAQDVVVSNPSGNSSPVSADRFTYRNTPAVTGVAPAAGPLAGGGTVTITGGGFTSATKVLFAGTTPATNLTVVSDTKLTATVPARSSGTVGIIVKTPAGTSPNVAAGDYTYTNSPAVTGLTPAGGPSAGRTTVTVTGAGFTGATGVLFGSVAATDFTVVSDNQITATAPAGSGVAAVVVAGAAGTSAKTGWDNYTYAPVPNVAAVSPSTGPTTGATTVTVTGTGFTGATAVAFAATPALAIRVLSASSLLAIAPAGTGTADITVVTPGGASSKTAVDRYTYAAAPTGFSYNGDGLRMAESMASGSIAFTWDTQPAVPELLSDNNANYIYGPGGLPIEQIDKFGNNSYFFHDAVGSTRALLAANGTLGATFTYTPYGGLKASTGTLSTPLLFAQSYSDGGTGLAYVVNRYYDPATGLFMTIDPDLSQTRQPFGYADDNPVNVTDPSGECWWGWSCLKKASAFVQTAADAAAAYGSAAFAVSWYIPGVDVVDVTWVGTALTFSELAGTVNLGAACLGGSSSECAAGVNGYFTTGGLGNGVAEEARGLWALAENQAENHLNSAINAPGYASQNDNYITSQLHYVDGPPASRSRC